MRRLAPSLALITLVGTASAADNAIRPEFDFGGFINAWFAVGNDQTRDDDATAIDEDRFHADFRGYAAADVDIRFTDQIDARLALWLIPSGRYSDPVLRDMFIGWHNDDWSVTLGKNIRPLGWVRPDPSTWYRVRASTIGYTTGDPLQFRSMVFGNDVLGGTATWHPRDIPFQATLLINNGFFSNRDDGNYDAFGRERNGLGYGAELAFIPGDIARVDFEVAYDPRSTYFDDFQFGMHDGNGVPAPGPDRGAFDRTTTGAPQSGGDGLLLALNTTVKPIERLTIGAEIARLAFGETVEADEDEIANTDYDRWQGLLMGNYALDGTPFPMSVTAMVQHIRAEQGPVEGQATEYTAALLTKPFTSVPLSLDGEITYATAESDQTGDANGIELAVRGLLTF